MKNTDKYNDMDWEKLAAKLSGEATGNHDLPAFDSDEELKVVKTWAEIGNSTYNADVDAAWKKVNDRITESEEIASGKTVTRRLWPALRIAAAIALLAGIGLTILYLPGNRNDMLSVSTGANDRNVEVTLPDGSKVWLNRNSELSYPKEFKEGTRNVKLNGEAFFDISHDASHPFIIDAGNGTVRVLGTSFNVITSNSKNEVEVLVETGKVMLSDASGNQTLILEPGYIGQLGNGNKESHLNENQNYIAWKTDLLVYNGQKLDAVFSDLKRVYNINIIADDSDINSRSLVGVFDKMPQDTVIKIICTTFNLSSRKEGDVYHLSR
ncbi:MAG: FecR domain-containing protein [Bacteroidales bacterium]